MVASSVLLVQLYTIEAHHLGKWPCPPFWKNGGDRGYFRKHLIEAILENVCLHMGEAILENGSLELLAYGDIHLGNDVGRNVFGKHSGIIGLLACWLLLLCVNISGSSHSFYRLARAYILRAILLIVRLPVSSLDYY
jgi:hypothetical protein